MEKLKLRRCWLASLLAVLCVTAVWRATFWIPQPIFAQEAAEQTRPAQDVPMPDAELQQQPIEEGLKNHPLGRALAETRREVKRPDAQIQLEVDVFKVNRKKCLDSVEDNVMLASLKKLLKGEETERVKRPVPFLFQSDAFEFWRDAMKKQDLAKTLAKPTIVVLNGHPASLISGGEFPVLTVKEADPATAAIEFREFGMKLNIKATLVRDQLILLDVDGSLTHLLPGNNDAAGVPIQSLVGQGVTSVAHVKVGQTLVLSTAPPENESEKNGDSSSADVLLFAITPTLVEKPALAPKQDSAPDVNLPLNAPVRPDTVDAANLIQLDAPQKIELVLNPTEEKAFRTADKILRVDSFDPAVIQVTAKTPNTIAVKASSPGMTTLIVTDERGGKFEVTIRVDPASHELQELLNWLYPDARIMVIRVQGAVLLRGVVTDAEHIQQFLEIAEQFFPKVLNQLKVAEKSERSAKPAPQKAIPPGVKAAKQKGEGLQALVDRLYPTAKVEVFTAQEAVILRGFVSESKHLGEVMELAEQYFPKAMNYLNVTSRDGVTQPRSELFIAALKAQFPQAQWKTGRPYDRLAVVVPSSMGEFDRGKISQLGRELFVSFYWEVDDTPLASVVPNRDAAPVAGSKLTAPSGKTSSTTASPVELELRTLHEDVRALREDLRRLIEKLEKRVPENEVRKS